MNPTRPLLSIGMIVKNEMRCLKRCLEALTPLRRAVPCELVIADTGSADGTRELAAQYADVLFDFPWRDDFSAARNAVLDRCAGVWHLQVDADEYLDGDCSQLTAFLTSKDAESYERGLVTVRNYMSDEMREDGYADFLACRLIRVDCGVRYQGAVHEAPCGRDGYRTVSLDRAVLHHDGYAGERRKGKKKRNLPLLEQELEQAPGDLRRIVQCLESSVAPEDKRKYARMAAEAAERGGDPYWRMAAFHDAVILTAELGFPELPLWGEKARALFPQSIMVGVGVSYGLAGYLSGIGEYEGALRETEAYFRAVARFDAGDYDRRELEITGVKGIASRNQRRMRFMQAECLGKLMRWPELAEALGKLALDGEHEDELYACYLDGLLKLWRHGEPRAEGLLRRMAEALGERREDYVRFAKLCRPAFTKPGEHSDTPPPRESWRLFAALGGGCDLGRLGLLMAAETAAEAEALLSGLERPALLPAGALEHALSLGAVLPDTIFAMEAEEISALAEGLAGLLLDEPARAFSLCPRSDEPGRALWGYTIAAALAGRVDWARQGSVELFDFFCGRAEEYTAFFFSEALRREENWRFLPRQARFAARCIGAREARRGGDELRYVRGLRAALRDGPDMKGMVNWLLAEAKERAAQAKRDASPELLALAAQVKQALAQYPAGHPAVREIKESPLYRQVAYLIENA